jgi:hypothetical protein
MFCLRMALPNLHNEWYQYIGMVAAHCAEAIKAMQAGTELQDRPLFAGSVCQAHKDESFVVK